MSTQNPNVCDKPSVTWSPLSGSVRQRSRRACLPCRQRKKKCDGNLPCSTCTGYGYACQYDDDVRRTVPKRDLASDASSSSHGARADRPSTQLQKSPRRDLVTPSAGAIFEPSKLRYMNKYSCIAFPLLVGLELQATNPPRLHSFAYHTGLRKEIDYVEDYRLVDHVSWYGVQNLLEVYSSTIHPIFGFLDMASLHRRCEEHWNGKPQGIGFESVISGVIALASLFSGFLREDAEMRVVQHAKATLDSSRYPYLDQISALILRTIYIRATSRPHGAWLCSCITMHSLEATGLQQELDDTVLSDGKPIQNSEEKISDLGRRTAQVAHCVHVMIAYEYGRSIMGSSYLPEELNHITIGVEDLTPQLYRLIKCIPPGNVTKDRAAETQDLSTGLGKVVTTPVSHDFLILVRTDLAFSIYRRLRLLVPNVPRPQLDQVIDAGLSALPAARSLARQRKPWWNVIGTVFQLICVLLVVDTTASIAKVPESMETLEMIVEQLSTHLANEALSTARQLVRASLDKKCQDSRVLESIPGLLDPTDSESLSMEHGTPFDPLLQFASTTDFDSVFGANFMI